MTFVSAAFILAIFCFLFSALAAWCAGKSSGYARSLLFVYSVVFLSLTLFAVLVGTALSIEQTNLAPCENLLNSTHYNYINETVGNPQQIPDNLLHYTYNKYINSCADRTTPSSIEMLYVAYAYTLLAVILVSVLSVMFIGLKRLWLEW